MKIGTYYYPEQWPREQWERDFNNIVKMGFQIVHMAEFAWYTMEPSPGTFHFDWLDTCVEMAAQRKLDVILCTPTAAPPSWLIDQHPDVLPVNKYGQRGRFGGRRHYTPLSPSLREATTRIVTAMADRFGGHPSIIGWQIDNEYNADFDQSEHAHRGFQQWLERRYGSLDALNQAWGCQFWNTYYTRWEQILLPAERLIAYDNPHQRLDASRFWSWAFADFNKLQAEIIKERVTGHLSLVTRGRPTNEQAPRVTSDKGQVTRVPFITTNFMPLHPDVNPADMAEDLSLMAWDSYPMTSQEEGHQANQEFRMADPAGIGFVHDHMASFNGRWALLEVQPGQLNWSGYPSLPYPGAIRLWLWTAIAHGAEFITVYRFRRPLWGTEMFHDGLVEVDGVTPSTGGREFMQVIEEVSRLRLGVEDGDEDGRWKMEDGGRGVQTHEDGGSKIADGGKQARSAGIPPSSILHPPSSSSPPSPGLPPSSILHPPSSPSAIGILLDFDQLWYYLSMPQAKKWKQPAWIYAWYGAATRLGLPIHVIHPDRPWPEHLKMVIAPGVQMVDDALVSRWGEYVAGGGNLVLTCRTGTMTKTGQFPEGPMGQAILPLIGAKLDAYDSLPQDTLGTLDFGGRKFNWNVWADLLTPDAGTETLGRYTDQFYAGAVGITRKPHEGGGSVTYCGVYGEQDLLDALIAKLAADVGLPTENLPARVQVLRRGRYRILLNYRDETIEAPARKNASFVVGARRVGPAGVAVWEE